MKKIFLALLIVTAASVSQVNAQLQKGNVFVGSDLANFDLGLNKSSQFKMSIDPKAAWFIANNLAVGANVDLGLTAQDGSTTVDYEVGALARYYLGTNQVNTTQFLRHTRAFVEGNVGIAGHNESGGATTNGLGLRIGPGIAYFITPNVGFETLLKYNGIIGGGNSTLNNRLALNFGFQIYLPGRTTRTKVMNDVK